MLEKEIFEYVSTNIFQDIFNETDVTLRNNIRLTILNDGKSVQGMLYNNVVVTTMPTGTGSYYLYICDSIDVSNLLGEIDTWSNLGDILNDVSVSMDIVSVDNLMLPKRLIYGKRLLNGKTIIAITTNVFKRYNVTHLTPYLIINADTDVINDKSIISHIPGVEENFTNLYDTYVNSDPDKSLYFVNGYNYRRDVFPDVSDPATDDMEVYVDENVLYTFTVNLDDRKTYLSETEELYKDIILVPSGIADNEMLTFDTFTIIVRDIDGKGVMLPFTSETSVSQLTHNCIGLSSHLIDAALDKLGVTTGELYIQISGYSKNNDLLPNGMMTTQLYEQTDEFIINAITNKLVPSIPAWTGSVLEDSGYAKHMIDVESIREYDPVKISEQISSLGYYNYAVLTCRHSGEIVLDTPITQLASVAIPIPVYWSSTELYPLIYLNGSKVKSSRYTTEVNNGNIIVTFSVPLAITSNNSIIQYQLMTAKKPTVYNITPDIDHRVMAIPNDGSIKSFLRVISNDIQSVTGPLGHGYMELPNSSNSYYNVTSDDNNLTIVFSELGYGQTFAFTYTEGAWFEEHYDINLDAGDTIAFIPAAPTINDHDVITNLLISGSYEVYLNGRFLTPDIDYRVVPVISLSDPTILGGYQIVIQNLKFLKDNEPNDIELFKTNQETIKADSGYIVDGIIPLNNSNEAWVPGLSRMFINGGLVPWDKLTRRSTHYEVDLGYYSNGDVYHYDLGVSTDFKASYQEYEDPAYFSNRIAINQHLTNGYEQTLPEQIIIPFVNRIYSSYINEIIKRINDGSISVENVNNDADILLQLVSYDYLKKFDVMFDQGTVIDTDYVDLYPSYLANLSVDDLNKYLFINRLVEIILGHDTVSDDRIVYTGN